MTHRDIVVAGASAGGVEALRAVVAGLPADFPASMLIVLHLPRHAPSALPAILGRSTTLPVAAAVDGDRLRAGHIYVAPPDRHLLVVDDHIGLSRGPTENGHRPAIDPLFRSAALAGGPRVIGVVLSGSLDDGAAGLAVVTRRGGLAVVQDPEDALHPSMPRAALERVEARHVVPAARIGPVLAAAVGDRLEPEGPDTDHTLVAEMVVSELDPLSAENVFEPAGYGCPTCGGSLFLIDGEPVPRYRCRIGHAWSPDSLLEEQAAAGDGALWVALRALEERASLGRRMAARTAGRGTSSRRYHLMADDADRAAADIRRLIAQWSGAEAGRPGRAVPPNQLSS
jgi:two-component system chemotaxis response regulator CheB